MSVDPETIREVKARKERRRNCSRPYTESPKCAFIVHSFNRISNLACLVEGIRAVEPSELIVCEDGSIDGSHEAWMEHLQFPNDFLIHSNDLHEIRILDRAIRFTKAEIVCLVQDDDMIPRTRDWLDHALQRFDEQADLAILGGFMGFGSFHPDPERAKRIWGDAPFQFVHHVNIGPYFIRVKHYKALGGWDYSFSDVGEPAICFDNELCLRAWVGGYTVGYRFVPFKGPAGHYSLDGGTVLFSERKRRSNQLRNQDRIWEMYKPHVRLIDERVKVANKRLG